MVALTEITDVGIDAVIGYRINGRINVDDIGNIKRLIEDKIQRHPKLRVYVEVINLDGISFEALVDDLKLAFKHYDKFERKAVVTDKKWIQTLSPIAGRFFPGIEVKCYSFTDRDKALEWIKS